MSKQVDCFQWILRNYGKINLVQFQNNASALFVNNVYRVLGVRPTRSGIGTPQLMVFIENELTMSTTAVGPRRGGCYPIKSDSSYSEKYIIIWGKFTSCLGKC